MNILGYFLVRFYVVTDFFGLKWVRALPKYIKYKIYVSKNKLFKPQSKLSRELNKNGVLKFNRIIPNDIINDILNQCGKRKATSDTSLTEHYSYDSNIINPLYPHLEEVLEIANIAIQAELPISKSETGIYITKTQKALLSSYLWHHDGHFQRFKIMVLLTAADTDSCMKIDLGSHKTRLIIDYDRSRYPNYKAKNVYLCAGDPGDVFLFNTSVIHKAGNPNKNNPRVVAVLGHGETEKYML